MPGRPDRAGERRTIAELERLAPRLAATGPPRVPALRGAEHYFAELGSYLDARYAPAARVGDCTLRERVEAAPKAARALPGGAGALRTAR